MRRQKYIKTQFIAVTTFSSCLSLKDKEKWLLSVLSYLSFSPVVISTGLTGHYIKITITNYLQLKDAEFSVEEILFDVFRDKIWFNFS